MKKTTVFTFYAYYAKLDVVYSNSGVETVTFLHVHQSRSTRISLFLLLAHSFQVINVLAITLCSHIRTGLPSLPDTFPPGEGV